MYRKIIERLKEWKDSDGRKPLILLGARQVGKTWLMKEFGKTCYDSVAYVNCDNEPLAKDLFKADYNIPRILLTIQAITGIKVEPGRTLVVIDEIQEAPRGLHSLKYFCEDAPEYHVVTAGSLLGVTLGQKESFPVGKVNMIQVQPMDFEEFLLATGHQNLLDSMHHGDWTLLAILDTKYQELLRQYYFVGGMPEVVKQYALHQDLKQVREIQHEIMESYRKDIAKHATKGEAVRITQVLDSIVSQLTKENKKFIYGIIKKGARAAQYELAIQWLVDAGIVYKVPRVSTIKMPLKAYEDTGAFKLFLLDCGLFGMLADAPANQVLTSNNIFKEYKGAFAEQYVFQQFEALNIHPHYWSNDGTPAEIDFVIQVDARVIPVEVKAEENVRAKSMSEYIKNHPDDQLKGLRISMRGYVNQDKMENIPLYAISKYLVTLKK
ncbi:MAG: ATP-binding protein [Bacteroidales bacterium]|nr:ATP-binding protein [Bacteroidales bacterium]